jgi:hypothetical protein
MIERPIKIAPNMPPLHAQSGTREMVTAEGYWVSEDNGKRDHAKYSKKVACKAGPGCGVEFHPQVGVQALLDKDANAGSDGKDGRPYQVLHWGRFRFVLDAL